MNQKKYAIRGEMSYYSHTWQLKFAENEEEPGEYRLLQTDEEIEKEATFWTIDMARKAMGKIRKTFPMTTKLDIVPVKVKIHVNHPYGWEPIPKDKKDV
jgi:hypothetical protein